jgi:ABC-2 type transport system permease protein
MSTVLSLYRASIKEFVRDRSALFWTFAFPVIFIVLFGLIFSGNSSPSYTVGLVNEDGGAVGNALAQTFGQFKPFTIKTGTREAEVDHLKKGQIDLVIVIPSGLSQAVSSGQTAQVQMVYDPSGNPTNAQIVVNIVQQILANFNEGYTHVSPPLALVPQTVTAHHESSIDFLMPGILAMSLMQLGLFATATPLVSLRQDQVLRRLGATPLPRWKLLASQVMLRLTIGFAQAAVIVGLSIWVFNVHIEGSLLAVAGLVLLGALTFVAIGYLVASLARTVESANGITTAVNFPMMFLSGIFFPLALLPAFLTPVVRALPLTYLADALRQVAVGSVPEFPMMVDLAVLAGWALVCALLSARFFKWE